MKLLIVTQKVDICDQNLGFFHRWIIEFAKQVEFVVVICLEEGEHQLPVNVKVISLGKSKVGVIASKLPKGPTLLLFRLFQKIRYTFRFYQHIIKQRKNYDAVFVHMNPEYVVLGWLVWKILKKKIILWYTHKSVTWILKMAVQLVNIVCTASRQSLRLNSPKIRVMGHGIDTEMFVPGERHFKNTVSILSVGRISPVKDYDTLLKAFALIKVDVNVTMSIVGGPITPVDYAYQANLFEMSKRLGIERKVVFTGPTSHSAVVSLLQSADIFVNMSKTGSLDKAVLEAMACAVPSVSSNESFAEILEPWGLFLKQPGEVALADMLEGLILQKEKLLTLGFRLRDLIIHDHNLSSLVTSIVKLYP